MYSLEEAEELIVASSGLVVTSMEDLEKAVDYLARIKKIHKWLDEKRKTEKKPFTDKAKEVDQKYRPFLSKLEGAKELGNDLMVEFYLLSGAKGIKLDGSSVSFRTTVDFEVEDESIIPREYLVVDDKRIRAALECGENIPGVRRTEKVTPTSRLLSE